jgi:hypothetical protein
MLQVLQFFTYMGMPHPYKAPLLLVEGPVLEEYAGAWAVLAKHFPMLQSTLGRESGCLVRVCMLLLRFTDDTHKC